MKFILLIAFSLLLIAASISSADNKQISMIINLSEENTTNIACNLSILVTTLKDIYSSGEQIKFYNSLSEKTGSFSIKYYIIDGQNQTIKNPVITQNLDAKYFTPKEEHNNRIITIKNELLESSCNNTNINTSEKTILIQGNPDIEEKTTIIKNATIEKQATKKEKTQTSATKDFTIKPISIPESLLNGNSDKNLAQEEIYASGDEKAKNYSKYLLIAAVLLLVIHFITKGRICPRGMPKTKRLFSSITKKWHSKYAQLLKSRVSRKSM